MLYLGQKVRIDDPTMPTVFGKTGTVAKVRVSEEDGRVTYRVYVPGHPVIDPVSEDILIPVGD